MGWSGKLVNSQSMPNTGEDLRKLEQAHCEHRGSLGMICIVYTTLPILCSEVCFEVFPSGGKPGLGLMGVLL